MPAWDDVDARVRGLSGHLLGRSRLATLSHAPDLRALAHDLRESDYRATILTDTPSATELDLAVRRVAARRLMVIAHWARERRSTLAVVFEDEDRRSLSALLRGAAAGVSAEQRLAGLIPTPALPERALEELAQQPTPGALAKMLVSWRNPFGEALLTEAMHAKPDLFRLESALDSAFVHRALAAAGRQHELREFVAETIDIQNLAAALVLARGSASPAIESAYIEGGWHVDRDAFRRAASSPVPAAALLSLRRAVADPVLAEALHGATSPAGFERAALKARTRAWRRRATKNPLGPAPVLSFVLRLRAEATDLRTIAWGLALGGPVLDADSELVSP